MTSSRRAILLSLLVGCGAPPPGSPVPVEGLRSDRDALAGTWNGRYWSDRGRGKGHGTIHFVLRPGADTARGQIEMTFVPELELYGERAEACDLARRPCTTVDIDVVRVEGGSVRGTLAPYWNPGCDCRAVSEFAGRLDAGSLTGSFVTRRESGGEPISSGRWVAERRR